LHARPPDKSDLKELQLTDAAEEMAIAAGLPAPRLMLMDSWGANAAAIGTGPADACIVISRRVLDEMDRDEIQGVLAHLTASIGNGDLRIAFDIVSVFETCGLLVTLVNFPFGPEARGIIVKMARFCLTRGSPEAHAAEADELAELLARHVDMDQDDIDRLYDDRRGRVSLPRRFVRLLFFPILFTNMAVKTTLWFFTAVLLGPSIALLWRTRRYLADAGAVQLTRSPDGLTKALEKLAAEGGPIPQGTWASHLFFIGGSGSGSRPSQAQMQTMISAWKSTSDNPISTGASPIQPARGDEAVRMREEMKITARAAMRGDAQAIARMVAFSRAMRPGSSVPIPMNVAADMNAARHGDRAALERLREAKRQAFPSEAKEQQSSWKQSSPMSGSLLSFHPPVKRRLKRLQRVGAHVDQGELRPMSATGRLVVVLLWLVIGPLLLLAADLMLVAIAMMVMLNLLFLALWLAAIHGIFAFLGHG
jgi:Zn-dependent protease with chaperone function